jgi:hypothetical protein
MRKNFFFVNENQLVEWIEAAQGIRERFGLDKALGYLIGEKFYGVVSILHSDRKLIGSIDEGRKQSAKGHNPNPTAGIETEQTAGIGTEQIVGIETEQNKPLQKNESVVNWDAAYEEQMKRIVAAQEVLVEFATVIKNAFDLHEIQQYFDSHPRFGPIGHTCSEKDHEFLVKQGAIEHSLETEIEDALIFGDMVKYLGIQI